MNAWLYGVENTANIFFDKPKLFYRRWGTIAIRPFIESWKDLGMEFQKGLSPYNTAKMFVDALVKAEFLNKAGFEMSGCLLYTSVLPFSLLWAALKFTIVSIISMPEFSAIVLGMPSSDSANALTESCSLPFIELENVEMCIRDRVMDVSLKILSLHLKTIHGVNGLMEKR